MLALFISSADAFILVYDVTDATTFEEVRMIRDQIHETKGTTAVPIVVVGNKIDLVAENIDLREVSETSFSNVTKINRLNTILSCKMYSRFKRIYTFAII